MPCGLRVLKLLLDTNVVISGMFWRGPPYQLLLGAQQGKAALISCPELLAELTQVLSYSKFAPHLRYIGSSADQQVASYASFTTLLTLTYPLPRVCRDADDDKVLACGLTGQADFIVSGDLDLLSIGTYNSIPIVGAHVALMQLTSKP